MAPHSKPPARGRVRRTTGSDEHSADSSRYWVANIMSDRNARQKSEFFVVPQPLAGDVPASDHGGRTHTREEPPQERENRDMDTLEGNIWGLLEPSQVSTKQERIATLARGNSCSVGLEMVAGPS